MTPTRTDMNVKVVHQDGTEGVIVWLHGLGECIECFEAFLETKRLARWKNVIIELPGHGGSSPAPEPLTLDEQADLIADWLGARGIKQVILVGHSRGGVLALRIAERHSALVAKLVDVEGNKCKPDCTFSGKVLDGSLEKFVEGGFQKLVADLERDEDVHLRGYARRIRKGDPATFYREAVELVAVSESEDLASRLAHLRIPKLFIAGKQSMSPHALELLGRERVEVTVIPDAGHWPFLSHAELFTDALLEFLAR